MEDCVSRQAENYGSTHTINLKHRYTTRNNNVQSIIKAVVGNNNYVGATTVEHKLDLDATEWTPATTKLSVDTVCLLENETLSS